MQDFHENSRVWIYLSSRPFTNVETSDLGKVLHHFCKEWSAHGVNLQAAGEIHYNRFIILMVDETAAGASGCSIDSSVHFIQGIEREYNVELFNRMQVAWMEGTSVRVAPLQQLQQLFEEGIINAETLVFNNTITSKKDFETKWMVPFKESWMINRIKTNVSS